MKAYHLLLAVFALMIVACGGKSDATIDPLASIDHGATSKEAAAVREPVDDFGKMPHDKKFYTRLLIRFCKDNDNYEEKFGKEFHESGLIVNKTKHVNDNTVTATGLITDKGKRTNIKATIKRVAKDTYKITFEAEIDYPYCEKNRWDDTTATITCKE